VARSSAAATIPTTFAYVGAVVTFHIARALGAA
jgi:hypothetical protein